MKCELGPVYQGEGNNGARVTLALAHFFFFFLRGVYNAGRVTLALG